MDNFRLAPHFNFYEYADTLNPDWLEQNRQDAMVYLSKLLLSATYHMEPIRKELGDLAIVVHSGFRCEELNMRTPGSSDRSQHMKGEAVDFNLLDYQRRGDTQITFGQVEQFLLNNRIMFGQLILESADRGYGRRSWIHLSLGYPFRALDRCGQVLEMQDGKYTLLRRHHFAEWEL